MSELRSNDRLESSTDNDPTITGLPSPYTYVKINGNSELDVHRDLPGTKRIKALHGTGEVKTPTDISRELQNWAEGSSLHSEYWRKKGLPSEQVLLSIKVGTLAQDIDIYNFNIESSLTDEHLRVMQTTFRRIFERFPWLISHVRFVGFDNDERPSLVGDERLFPCSGTTMREGLHLFPKVLDLSVPHRVQQENEKYFDQHPPAYISNLEGTIIHETMHLDDSSVWKMWKEHGLSERLDKPWNNPQYSDEWQRDEDRNLWVHKKTSLVATDRLEGYAFSVKPEQCVTSYAAMNLSRYGDDIADSVVAYIEAPSLLAQASPLKFSIFKCLDQTEKHTDDNGFMTTEVVRVPKDRIKLPEVPESERIKYYYLV